MSFVVLTMNGWPTTLECVESIGRCPSPNDYEVVLVDNGSTDGMREHLEPALAPLHNVYLRLETNAGAAGGRNHGLHAASGDIVAFIDNDATVDPSCVETLIAYFDTHPGTDAAGCKIMRSRFPGQLENAGYRLDICGFGYTEGFGERDDGRRDLDRDIMGGVTSGLAVRRAALLHVGGLDERMFYQFEDADLCWRLWRMGHRIGFCHTTRVHHQNGGTIPRDASFLRLYARNRLWSLARNLDGVYAFAGIGLNALYCLALAAFTLFARGPRFALGVLEGLAQGFAGIAEARRLRRGESASVIYDTRALLQRGTLCLPSPSVLRNLRFTLTAFGKRPSSPQDSKSS